MKNSRVCCGQRCCFPLPASSREYQKMSEVLSQVICPCLLCDSSSDSPFWLQGILTSMEGVNDRSSLLVLLCSDRGDLEWSWGLDTACFLLGCFSPKSYCIISPLTLKLLAFPLFKEHCQEFVHKWSWTFFFLRGGGELLAGLLQLAVLLQVLPRLLIY